MVLPDPTDDHALCYVRSEGKEEKRALQNIWKCSGVLVYCRICFGSSCQLPLLFEMNSFYWKDGCCCSEVARWTRTEDLGEFGKAGSPHWQQPLPCWGAEQGFGRGVLGVSSLCCFFQRAAVSGLPELSPS